MQFYGKFRQYKFFIFLIMSLFDQETFLIGFITYIVYLVYNTKVE